MADQTASQDKSTSRALLKTGLLAVYKGFPPAIAVEFARRVLPHEVRPSFEETEQYCKGQKAAPAEGQAQAA